MTGAEILRGIAAVAHEHLGWGGPVEPEMDLVEDLELDSLRLLTLAVEVENRFRVCLEQEDEARIRTVGDLVEIVQIKLANPANEAAKAEGTGA